ncbi:hypothetical protein [Sandaracinus amylolyticus]|uniref:hypothetical protein n=1 Tax=Sandaracinus amylolyticus TaxID=927083 RepID=UPI001F42AB4B|nr:hypothetical protein [Sandaracinus amylolyticus]UJR85099.1 Hypothetical protein I5071_71790 [Sandaracinus amylolyticus]
MTIERGLPLLLALALLGCGESVDGCFEASSASEGARCDFDESDVPCTEVRDGPTNCGYTHYTCVDGRLRIMVIPFECPRLDGGAGSACDAYEPPPAATTTECRSDADCDGTGSCWAPGDTSAFYATGFCPMECDADGECGASQVCVELNQGSCSQCRERCTATSCSRWETCGDDGHCRPLRCDEGYACPVGSTCVPGGLDDVDAHGCTTVPCDSDDDCGCGACVFGSCALGPGRCEPPRP